jgi:flagellar protein FlaH
METYNFAIERDGLHRRLGGGLPRGCVAVIAGPYGAGKSVFCQRLTYGFMLNGVSVTYVSTEMTATDFIQQMKSLDYDVADRIISKSLMFFPVLPIIGKARSERTDFLRRLISTTHLYDRDVIIVDTFSSLVKGELNPQNAIEALSFFKKMSARGKVVILTMDTAEMPEDLLSPFKASAEVSFEIKTRIIEGELSRTLMVQRYAKAKDYVSSIVGFRVEPNIGIIVDITTVA